MSDYKKVEAYSCERPNCNQVRSSIEKIESHIHIAHGIPFNFIMKPTEEAHRK